MSWALSTAESALFVELATAGSTNTELAARAAAGFIPEFTVVATLDQTAGRGRLGRSWTAPAGKALAASVLLRPVLASGAQMPAEQFGWLPLIAGMAMVRSVAALVPAGVTSLKWPNDVLIDDGKASGILAELLPDATSVVIGAGVNLTVEEAELPTETATSLALHGAPEQDLADRVLSNWLHELRTEYQWFLQHDANAEGSGIRQRALKACSTIGRAVRVDLPDGSALRGRATDIDASGRLVVVAATDGHNQAVAAGDVTHLRYE